MKSNNYSDKKSSETSIISLCKYENERWNSYSFLWLAFISIFLLVGAIGHDPWWKKGEAYSFGIIYHFYITGTWLIPINAGLPFMEKPPLYYWTAVIFCHLLKGILPLHDAARTASVLYMIVACLFTWKTSLVLFRKRENVKDLGVITVALFAGTYGLVRYSHAMSTDVALLAGVAVALYGMAIICMMPEHWKKSGFWLGLGLGISFMSKGFIAPGMMMISGLILLGLLPQLRTKKTIWAILFAFAVSSPFLLIWPLLLYKHSPHLFMELFWENNVGRFLGFSVKRLGAENRPFYFLWMIPVFAFPIFPLACAHIVRARKEWCKAEYLLPFIVSLTGLTMLLISASGRAPYLLLLMPGLALLATQSLAHMPTRFFPHWNNVVRIMFTITAIGVWLTWWSLLHPPADRPIAWLPALFDKWLPQDFIPQESQWLSCLVCIFVSCFWIASFRLEKYSARNTARIWFLGAALIWCSIYTLLSPWINETRSFRTVLTQFTNFFEASPYAKQCVGNYELGENIAPMLQYFTHKQVAMPLQNLDQTTCPLILTFIEKDTPFDFDRRWNMIWKGSGFLDIRGMELRLYEHKK